MADLKNYNGENIENLLLATTTSPGLICPEDKAKVDTVKAFAAIAVGDTVVEATDTVDTLVLENGSNVAIQPDPNNKKIVIAAQNTTYDLTTSKSSTNGNVKVNLVPNSGTTDSITIKGTGATSVTTDANGVVTVGSTNTTYRVATTSANGLMSKDDKSKLDGIATNANKYTHPSYTAKSAGLYKVTVDATGHVSAATAVAKSDITALGIPGQDTTYSDMTGATGSANGTHGLVPAPPAGKQYSFLRGDGTWVIPTNTTYGVMGGATTDAAGVAGLVPAPAKGSANRYLRSDATWQVPPNTTYSVATTSANGLMSSSDKTKLDGIATGANKYTHPTYTAKSAGFYKVTVDGTGHVSAATAVTKADITGLGIPAQDTTYGVATTSANGLMSSTDKTKLDGIATGANKYTHPTSHAATMITQDSTHRFVTDTEKSTWNAKVGLDSNGFIPSSVLPSYVDDVIEGYYNSSKFYKTRSGSSGSYKYSNEITGETGKIYINLENNKTYRWSGSAYAVISETLALGETSSTAYPGNKGKANADAITNIVNGNTKVGKAGNADTVNGLTVRTAVPANAKFTDTVYSHPTSSGNKHIPSGGSAGQILRWSADGTAAWGADNNTTYSVATSSANGLMSSSDKSKLDGIATGANKYSHPTYTARSAGLYKITVDGTGHVSAVTAVAKADITGLGIPGQDTTYSNMTAASSSAAGTAGLVPAPAKGAANRYLRSDATWQVPPNTTYSAATTSAAGLMSASDKSKLNGITAGANKVTISDDGAGNVTISIT